MSYVKLLQEVAWLEREIRECKESGFEDNDFETYLLRRWTNACQLLNSVECN